MHYSTKLLRKMCDIWEEHGPGLIALHGQSGNIMFQGCTTENVRRDMEGRMLWAFHEYKPRQGWYLEGLFS
jgi:dissimilatory sulfite reductase (desulfoviridin) alpha/beta subunit